MWKYIICIFFDLFYLNNLNFSIEKYDIKISTIARGISVGDELEYADEVTLGRSILNRVPFEQSIRG